MANSCYNFKTYLVNIHNLKHITSHVRNLVISVTSHTFHSNYIYKIMQLEKSRNLETTTGIYSLLHAPTLQRLNLGQNNNAE